MLTEKGRKTGEVGMSIHVLRKAVEPEGEKQTLAEMKKQMPPCPICGKKAYLMHMFCDEFDFGYSAGCPSYRLEDGVHGISECFDPKAPMVDGYSAEEAMKRWIAYCERSENEKTKAEDAEGNHAKDER